MKTTPWHTDPNNHKYRIRYDIDGRPWVEYKKSKPKLPPYPLISFFVKVRGEEWHVKSKDAESAAWIFMSDVSKHMPDRHEIEVIESDK